jgi:hypothetical protein
MNAPTLTREITRDEYHADYSAQSKGMLADFLDRRLEYYLRYVEQTAPPVKTTKAMDIGTGWHAALLQPHLLDELVVTYPAEVLAKVDGQVSPDGAASTKAAKNFCEVNEAAGRIVLKEKDMDVIKAMAASVLRSTVGKWLQAPAAIEKPRYWTDEVSGLRCRCLPDWYNAATGIMIDLKSTARVTPASFAKQADELRYWLQTSHYLDSIGGEGRFLFVAVESSWPFETIVYEYPLSDGGDSMDLEFADGVRHRALQEIAECQQTGIWRDSWSGCVNPVFKRYSKGKA